MILTLDEPGRIDTHGDAGAGARTEPGELCLTLSRRGCRVAGQGVELRPIADTDEPASRAFSATTDPHGRLRLLCPPGRYVLRLAATVGTEVFSCSINAGAMTAMSIMLG